jgi:hypothetical protein
VRNCKTSDMVKAVSLYIYIYKVSIVLILKMILILALDSGSIEAANEANTYLSKA